MDRNTAKIEIRWLSPQEGGRSQPFVGRRYAPTAQFRGESEPFSVVLVFANINQSNPKEGTLELLFPDRLKDIQSRITPGAELEIMEGSRVVGLCRVASVPGYMAESTGTPARV